MVEEKVRMRVISLNYDIYSKRTFLKQEFIYV